MICDIFYSSVKKTHKINVWELFSSIIKDKTVSKTKFQYQEYVNKCKMR